MDPVQIAGTVTAITGAAGAVVWAVRSLWRTGRRVGHALDDILGVEETPSREARPGFGARLRAIEARLDKHLTRHTERVWGGSP